MPAPRRLPLLALLLTAATLASEAQAAPRATHADGAPRATPGTMNPAARTAGPGPRETTSPDPGRTDSKFVRPRATSPHVRPTTSEVRESSEPRTQATREPVRKRARGRSKASPPVPKDSTLELAAKPPGARPLRPRSEPLLARHPAATCALDPLEAVGLRQHGRTRESLREFYWSDMARFFETAVDLAEPVPQQVKDPAFVASEQVLRDLPAAVRAPLATIAAARVVDRLGDREFAKVSKLLASLGPAQVASLLRADAPTLRAYVWTWLATTKTGGCHLGHLDLDFIEAAVGDRSVAVEHGDDLVYRSLGDYALAARARIATLDPTRFDSFLVRLTAATEIDPLVRATAHGILLRRAHQDSQATGLRDPSPSVRAATAAAAIEMNRDRVEPALLEHAAADPADLVTELIVGALLGVFDPHNHGRPQLRGLITDARDERLAAAVARWRGRGDPLEPLPAPRKPLRFAALAERPVAEPALEPAAHLVSAPQPVPSSSHPAARASAPQPVPSTSHPVARASDPQPVPSTSRPVARAEPAPRRTREPALPGVLDEPNDAEDLAPGSP